MCQTSSFIFRIEHFSDLLGEAFLGAVGSNPHVIFNKFIYWGRKWDSRPRFACLERWRPPCLLLSSERQKTETKYFFLRITYIDLTSPPKLFMRLTTSALYLKLIRFNSFDGDSSKIKNVFILSPPRWIFPDLDPCNLFFWRSSKNPKLRMS